MWASISTTITNAFAAIGKIKLNLKLMVMWTALTWILTPILVLKFGYNGAALASALVATSSFVPIIILKKLLPIDIGGNITLNVTSALIMGAVAWVLVRPVSNLPGLFLAIGASGVLYILMVMALQRNKLFAEIASVRQIINKK